jgi:hypothetical protein
MLGGAMTLFLVICWPISLYIGFCIAKPAEVGFVGVAACYAMVVACLSILFAGLPGGLYIVTKDDTRKSVYHKYFRRMIFGGLGVLIALMIISIILIVIT